MAICLIYSLNVSIPLKKMRLEGERGDGESEDDLITAFRCELRAALLVATAKGTAEMLAVAGRPFRKGGAQRNGAWPGARMPAARAAVDGTDDMPVSDSGTHSCESDSGSGTSAAPPHNIFSVVVCEGFPVVS